VSSSDPLLEVVGLSAAWDGLPVLRSISFDVAPGEFLVLLGPNGSGKTTLLRCLAGLERPTSGRVTLSGADLGTRPPHTRGIGLMFQESALFPHRTVYENIAYAPLLQHLPHSEVEQEVDRVIALLQLGGFEDRRPDQLSGGERQRVALARTLAARPKLVLLDEPFASIDAEVKADLHSEFRRALSASGTAAIHVTHDRQEGLFLGDRVGLLFEGSLESIGAPREIYDRPPSVRAARFLGYNILPGANGTVAVHPTDVRWCADPGTGVAATVVATGTTGRDQLVVLRTADGTRAELQVEVGTRVPPLGARGSLTWERSVALPR
jgi:ABC-type Fe3+/spermidine/putrescine transport system ATPase subunit